VNSYISQKLVASIFSVRAVLEDSSCNI